MELYIKLNSLIQANISTSDIVDYMRDNFISAATFDAFNANAKFPCPLTQAALHGRWDVMKALFDIGFSPHEFYDCAVLSGGTCTEENCTALRAAVNGGHLSVVKSLIEECDVDVEEEDCEHQEGALLLALVSLKCKEEDRLPMVRCLVEAGADMEKGRWILAPVHFASSIDRGDIIEYLISEGAEVINEEDPSGSVLEYLASERNDKCSCLLLENAEGLDIKEVFDEGQTLLHVYAEYGLAECVRLCCSLGWNPDAQDTSGQTPLHTVLGTSMGLKAQTEFNIVSFLIIEWNASMHLKDISGQTPFDKVVFVKNVRLVELFLLAGYSTSLVCIPKVKHLLETLAQENKSIQEMVSTPRTLRDLCCYKVRRVLSLRIHSTVDSLPLPQQLKDFVKLKHVQNDQAILV